MERRQFFGAALAGVKVNVVADRVRRPETDHCFGIEPAFIHQLLQHALRVFEQLPRRRTLRGVVENGWIAALHFPSLEERRPIDVGDEFAHVVTTKHARAR